MANELDLQQILHGITAEEASLFAESVLVFRHIDQLVTSGRAAAKTLTHRDADQIQNVSDRVHKALDELRMASVDFDGFIDKGNDKISCYTSGSFQDLVRSSRDLLGVYLLTMPYKWSATLDPDSPYRSLFVKPAPVPAQAEPQMAGSPSGTSEATPGEPTEQEGEQAGGPKTKPTPKRLHPRAVLFPFGLGMPKRGDKKDEPKPGS